MTDLPPPIDQFERPDPILTNKIVTYLKSQGIFDQFRRECMADVDTKPAYQNLRQRVEGSVAAFLKKNPWRPDMNKNQLRDNLRKHIQSGGFLDIGVDRIVDQVVNPKIYTVFLPKVEEVVHNCLEMDKDKPKFVPPPTHSEKPDPPKFQNKHNLAPRAPIPAPLTGPNHPTTNLESSNTLKPEENKDLDQGEVKLSDPCSPEPEDNYVVDDDDTEDNAEDDEESPPFEPHSESDRLILGVRTDSSDSNSIDNEVVTTIVDDNLEERIDNNDSSLKEGSDNKAEEIKKKEGIKREEESSSDEYVAKTPTKEIKKREGTKNEEESSSDEYVAKTPTKEMKKREGTKNEEESSSDEYVVKTPTKEMKKREGTKNEEESSSDEYVAKTPTKEIKKREGTKNEEESSSDEYVPKTPTINMEGSDGTLIEFNSISEYKQYQTKFDEESFGNIEEEVVSSQWMEANQTVKEERSSNEEEDFGSGSRKRKLQIDNYDEGSSSSIGKCSTSDEGKSSTYSSFMQKKIKLVDGNEITKELIMNYHENDDSNTEKSMDTMDLNLKPPDNVHRKTSKSSSSSKESGKGHHSHHHHSHKDHKDRSSHHSSSSREKDKEYKESSTLSSHSSKDKKDNNKKDDKHYTDRVRNKDRERRKSESSSTKHHDRDHRSKQSDKNKDHGDKKSMHKKDPDKKEYDNSEKYKKESRHDHKDRSRDHHDKEKRKHDNHDKQSDTKRDKDSSQKDNDKRSTSRDSKYSHSSSKHSHRSLSDKHKYDREQKPKESSDKHKSDKKSDKDNKHESKKKHREHCKSNDRDEDRRSTDRDSNGPSGRSYYSNTSKSMSSRAKTETPVDSGERTTSNSDNTVSDNTEPLHIECSKVDLTSDEGIASPDPELVEESWSGLGENYSEYNESKDSCGESSFEDNKDSCNSSHEIEIDETIKDPNYKSNNTIIIKYIADQRESLQLKDDEVKNLSITDKNDARKDDILQNVQKNVSIEDKCDNEQNYPHPACSVHDTSSEKENIEQSVNFKESTNKSIETARSVEDKPVKFKKPKIAANIFEVKKIMQARRHLKRMEKKRIKLLTKNNNEEGPFQKGSPPLISTNKTQSEDFEGFEDTFSDKIEKYDCLINRLNTEVTTMSNDQTNPNLVTSLIDLNPNLDEYIETVLKGKVHRKKIVRVRLPPLCDELYKFDIEQNAYILLKDGDEYVLGEEEIGGNQNELNSKKVEENFTENEIKKNQHERNDDELGERLSKESHDISGERKSPDQCLNKINTFEDKNVFNKSSKHKMTNKQVDKEMLDGSDGLKSNKASEVTVSKNVSFENNNPITPPRRAMFSITFNQTYDEILKEKEQNSVVDTKKKDIEKNPRTVVKITNDKTTEHVVMKRLQSNSQEKVEISRITKADSNVQVPRITRSEPVVNGSMSKSVTHGKPLPMISRVNKTKNVVAPSSSSTTSRRMNGIVSPDSTTNLEAEVADRVSQQLINEVIGIQAGTGILGGLTEQYSPNNEDCVDQEHHRESRHSGPRHQRYDSSDLYKPRLQLSSRRVRSQQTSEAGRPSPLVAGKKRAATTPEVASTLPKRRR